MTTHRDRSVWAVAVIMQVTLGVATLPMQQSPPSRAHAIAPCPVHDPRDEYRVEDEGREQEKNWDHERDEGNDEWSGAHMTPPRKNAGGRPMSAVTRMNALESWRR